MTLGELRAFLARADVQALPDNTPVGAQGHYGEFCGAYYDELTIKTVSKFGYKDSFVAVIIPAIDIGPEPD